MSRHLINLLIMLLIVVFLSACEETQYDINTRTYEAKFAYIPITEENGAIKVINTATATLVTTIFIGRNPTSVAINDDGSRVYVTLRNSESEDGSVAVINTKTNSSDLIPQPLIENVGYQPGGLLFHSPTGDIYVTHNYGVTHLAKSDLEDGTYVVSEVTIPTAFNSTSIDYAGDYIITTGTIFDEQNLPIKSGVSMFNYKDPTEIYDLDLGYSGASGIAIQETSGELRRIFVANRIKDTISVIELTANGLEETDTIGTLRPGTAPSSLAYDPEYGRLFVANSAQRSPTSAGTNMSNGGIAVIDLNTGVTNHFRLGTFGSDDTFSEALHPKIVQYDSEQRRLYVVKDLWLANATGTYLSILRHDIQGLDIDSEIETLASSSGPGPYMVSDFVGPVCNDCPQGELVTLDRPVQASSIDMNTLLLLVLVSVIGRRGSTYLASKKAHRS